MILPFTRTDEHDGKINIADTKPDDKLFVTGGDDGFVKIWTI